MKLSEILKTKDLSSVTVNNHNQYVVAQIFIKGRRLPVLKVARGIKIDVDLPEISNWTVKHLGVKRCFYHATPDYYVNYYIY